MIDAETGRLNLLFYKKYVLTLALDQRPRLETPCFPRNQGQEAQATADSLQGTCKLCWIGDPSCVLFVHVVTSVPT